MIPSRSSQLPRYDADEVRLALRRSVRTVVAALGYDARGRIELESARCPGGAHGRRRSMIVSVRKGLWSCKPCGTGGDMLDLVAASRGLDVRDDFAQVLAAAADLVGVHPIDVDPIDANRRRRETAERVALAVERDRQLQAAEDAQRARAMATAAALWSTLPARSASGEEYLRVERHIDPAPLIAAGDLKFRAGAPTVALYGSDGSVRNVVSRIPNASDDGKVRGMKHAPTAGTLVGHVEQIVGGVDVVITEGVSDSFIARLAWSHAVVLGAHGAENYAPIARVASPRVRLAGGRLLLCIDADDAGERAGIAAVRHALAAGLALDRTLVLVDHGDHHDLADAWAAGWRPA